MYFLTRRAVLAAGLAVGLTGHAYAQSVEEFYSGNTLTLIVSAGTGGGSDFFARQFAPYLSKHIPGNPEIIVQNVPGAGGMKAATLLQERGPFDGSTIALLQRNNFYVPLIDGKAEFKPREAHWLGSLNKEYYTILARADAPVKTPEDLFSKTLIIGATSYNNENRTFPALMNEFFGTKFDIVTGYEGNAAVGLAMERGEVQSRMQTVNTLLSGEVGKLVEAGELNIIAQVGVTDAPEFPDLPNMFDLVKDEHNKAVASFLLSPLAAGRPFAAPAGVPEDRVAALREAFMAASADPEFLVEMKRLNASVDVISGEDVQKIVEDIWNSPEPVLESVRKLMAPPN